MERNTVFCNLGLYIKSVLVLILLLSGSGSAWADELTVYDETNTSTRVPFQGSYTSTSYYSANAQFIYPSSALSDMVGKRIDKLTFYGNTISDEYASWGDAEFTVYMMEVDKTYFTEAAFDSWASMTAVYSGKVFSNARKMVIEMTTSINYTGKNLLIGFKRTKTGTIKAYNWFGKTQSTNTAVYQAYSASEEKASQEKFLPKITFSYYKAGTPSFFSSTVTNNTATLSWTVNGLESKWQVAYSTDINFNPDNAVKTAITANSCILSNLNDGVKYYAYVRSDYENGTYSDWCGKLEFVPQGSVILNDDEATSTYVPVNNYTKYGIKSQYVIKADNLSTIQNSIISEIVFYSKEYLINWTDATFDVYLNETDTYSIFDSYTVAFKSWGDKVYSAKALSVKAGEMSIVFDKPFKYSNGNLIIGIQQTSNTSSSVTSTWYGKTESTDYTSAYEQSNNGSAYTTSRQKFSPKVKIISLSPSVSTSIGLNGYTTFASHLPLDLTDTNRPEGLKAYKAKLDGNALSFEAINQTVPAGTDLLLKGSNGETYNIPVATSGDAITTAMTGVTTETAMKSDAEGNYIFVMKKASSASDALTFLPLTTASNVTIPAGKAYISVPASAFSGGGSSRALTISFDDETTTGISDMNRETRTNNNYYSLSGQRVSQPSKGLYIVNGKKVVMK